VPGSRSSRVIQADEVRAKVHWQRAGVSACVTRETGPAFEEWFPKVPVPSHDQVLFGNGRNFPEGPRGSLELASEALAKHPEMRRLSWLNARVHATFISGNSDRPRKGSMTGARYRIEQTNLLSLSTPWLQATIFTFVAGVLLAISVRASQRREF
jgi:hypothetical protein